MRCPKDDTELLQSERQGIEIEYCPTCNGAWV
ncbi:MAG: zf-TFIIB domain-containing protein, partial [Chloroflexota bacterium]|nr:zf-TFIIB domain-containing protein [Chloroflexota bacterium]